MAVKRPDVTETEYAQKVDDALPELQRIAQDNVGKIKTPRQAVGAINTRISEMEAPIAHHLETVTTPGDLVHPADWVPDVQASVGRALNDPTKTYKASELTSAQKEVGGLR